MDSARLISRFDGSGDVDTWLCRAELIVNAKKENPAEVIPVCLDGAAFAVYERMSAAHRDDFSQIRMELTRAFGLSVYDAFAAFSDLRLQAGESVEVYAIAVARLGRQCGITDDTALACKFVSGLPMDVCEKVKLSIGRTPRLKDATEAAQVLLANTRLAVDGFAGKAVRSTSASDSGGRWRRRCFKCGNTSHMAAQCRARVCFRCGQAGHLAHACPNCTASENYKGKIVPSPPQDNLPDQQQ